MYAGGKYGEGEDNYEFSLGLNGLGLCATQYLSLIHILHLRGQQSVCRAFQQRVGGKQCSGLALSGVQGTGCLLYTSRCV